MRNRFLEAITLFNKNLIKPWSYYFSIRKACEVQLWLCRRKYCEALLRRQNNGETKKMEKKRKRESEKKLNRNSISLHTV